MLRERGGVVSGIARAIDLIIISTAFVAAAMLCQAATHIELLEWLQGVFPIEPDIIHQYALLTLLSLLAWLAVTQWQESYSSHRAEHLFVFLLGHVTTQVLWAMLVGTLAFVFKLEYLSRTFSFTFLSLSMIMLTVRQLGTRAFLQHVRAKGHNIRRVIVLGESDRAREFARFIETEGGPGYQVVELAPQPNGKNSANFNIDFDEAFLPLGNARGDLEETLLGLVKLGKRVRIVPGLFDGTLFRQSLDEFAGVPVLSIGGHGADPIEEIAKRFLDFVGSLILLLIFSPAFLLSALLVKCSSMGPVLFSQERLGKSGRKFRMLKFRTMHWNAEERLRSDPKLYSIYLANNHKIPANDDPRIAPFGRFMRAFSLDELPQLFNVLRGDMSLVGPRPITPPQLDQYGEYAPLFLSAKPGITGYWQVHGRSEIRDFSHRTELDLEYIRDQSLKTDVHTLLKTIPAVLLRKGAN
jgi:exopolysaccharide biosynthesis polyprenyl glycosylphosphotransferase